MSTATSDRLFNRSGWNHGRRSVGSAAKTTTSGSAITRAPGREFGASFDSHRRLHDPLLLEIGAGEDAHLAALPHDEHAVTHRQHLREVGRDDDHRDAGS